MNPKGSASILERAGKKQVGSAPEKVADIEDIRHEHGHHFIFFLFSQVITDFFLR